MMYRLVTRWCDKITAGLFTQFGKIPTKAMSQMKYTMVDQKKTCGEPVRGQEAGVKRRSSV